MCGGSNLSTVLLLWGIYIKKCISLVRIRLQTRNARNASTKFRKNFRVEKSGEISRNLRFSFFTAPASESDTHPDWGSRIRTYECSSQSAVSYRLTIPQCTRLLYHRKPGLSRGFLGLMPFSAFVLCRCQNIHQASVIFLSVVLFRQPPSGVPPLQ